MSKAKLFIAVHGAALTNVMFMPKNSVVVEISPPHYKGNLYEKPAIQTGQHYFRLITQAESSLHSSPKFFNISARHCNSNIYCRIFWRNQNLIVDITKFSFLFEQVLEVL
ncbi:transferring glycosyl groups [Brachionus plicatilis]|uniref:Transferring glycosyl groups n=1 Tax=Brachionus plicatilis TaxID=10195 RepID=A0A3M7QAL3_BRAPC|nr:transferring glycosyl groups [Brachionus plicatilis]